MNTGKETTLTGLGGEEEGRGAEGRDSVGQGGWGGITSGEMPDVGNWVRRGVDVACMYLCNNPAGCRKCTCTPEPKVQFKKRERTILYKARAATDSDSTDGSG